MWVCVCVVGGLFDPVQSATRNLPHHQICPHNVLPEHPAVSNSAELSVPRIHWVSRWRDRAAEEDGTDSEDMYGDNDGEMDGTERWMQKWGLRNEYTLSEDEKDPDGENNCSSEERWRARAAVGMRKEEEEESDDEVESDLGSLRELGSEGEWEPFHHLQILCGSERQHREDEWSDTEEEDEDEECAPSAVTSESNLNLLKYTSLNKKTI